MIGFLKRKRPPKLFNYGGLQFYILIKNHINDF